MLMRVPIKYHFDDPELELTYQTEGSSGMDVHATKILKMWGTNGMLEESELNTRNTQFESEGFVDIPAGARVVFGTGLFVEIPSGFEMQVRPRSGMSFETGMQVMLGTIDSDYRGEVGVLVSSPEPTRVEYRTRIAQLVLAPVAHAIRFLELDLSETERGDGGFGSTGK